MPIYDVECQNCNEVTEFIKVRSFDTPICKKCGSRDVKVIVSLFHYRNDPDSVKHNLPDPYPPLEELRGKQKPGCEGGFSDKPYADTNLGNYERKKDKYGNTIWIEKRRTYFHK